MLARFSIIVAVDAGNGIAKRGEIPWHSPSDMQHFRETTTGPNRKNAVVFGRKTYEGIDEERRPLQDRYNVVISKSLAQEDHPGAAIFPRLVDALVHLGS